MSRVRRAEAPRASTSAVENLLAGLVEPDVRARISRAFELMSVAEEEIKAAMEVWPEQRKRVWNCFAVLCPGESIRSLAEEVYRAHCRELIERAVHRSDLRGATKAEIVAAISKASAASRLDRDVELLGLRLTAEIFPKKAEDLLGGMFWEESHAGALDEHLWDFRRKLAVEDRKLPETLREVPENWRSR